MLSRVLWLVLLLTGCSTARPVYIDANEGDALTFATMDAIELWNDALGFEAFELRAIKHEELGHVELCSIVVVGREAVAGADTFIVADTTPYVLAGVRIQVERSALQLEPGHVANDAQAADVVAHELGHALGLRHYEAAGNLMREWSYASGGRALTKVQLRRARLSLAACSFVAPLR